MKRLFASVLSFIAALALAGAVAAAPIPYVNSPMDTPQGLVNTAITSLNTTQPWAAVPVTCSGTTTATCTGLRFTASVTGLTTAAGVTSASMAVTDTSVTASSQVICQANGYGGTGNPQPVNVVATASTVTFQVQNTHASAALNATVPVVCLVYN
jgi:hypothetical protein